MRRYFERFLLRGCVAVALNAFVCILTNLSVTKANALFSFDMTLLIILVMSWIALCSALLKIEIRRGPDDRQARRTLGPYGCRELSILFVDIRSYTALTETMSTEEAFRTVSGYARRVSEIVAARGGHVFEFAGDGVMA